MDPEVIAELTGGPLDGQELDVPTPLPGHLMVPLLPVVDVLYDPDPDPADIMRIPVYYAYRRVNDLFVSGRMIRYVFEG